MAPQISKLYRVNTVRLCSLFLLWTGGNYLCDLCWVDRPNGEVSRHCVLTQLPCYYPSPYCLTQIRVKESHAYSWQTWLSDCQPVSPQLSSFSTWGTQKCETHHTGAGSLGWLLGFECLLAGRQCRRAEKWPPLKQQSSFLIGWIAAWLQLRHHLVIAGFTLGLWVLPCAKRLGCLFFPWLQRNYEISLEKGVLGFQCVDDFASLLDSLHRCWR